MMHVSTTKPLQQLVTATNFRVLHELLSLFFENSAERRMILSLRKHLGLSQKVHMVFEKHPNMFYLSFRNNACTTILKEAYCDPSAIEERPLLKVRKKCIKLMKESEAILKNRRFGNHLVDHRSDGRVTFLVMTELLILIKCLLILQ